MSDFQYSYSVHGKVRSCPGLVQFTAQINSFELDSEVGRLVEASSLINLNFVDVTYNRVLSMTQCKDYIDTLFTFFIFDFALIFLSISHVLYCHDKKGNSVQNADAVRDLI